MKDILPLSSDDFALFQELLIDASGLRFEEERNQSLHLALWERLQQRGVHSYREYYHLLKFHPEGRLEIRELLDLITVGQTYFFRNKAQFNVLIRSVLPEMIKSKLSTGDKSIRIWSAGCSRGDEPYSIAVAIKEVLPSNEDWAISILGTDINRHGLACAKKASYGEKDVAYLPEEYLDKYFEVKDGTYLLKSDVRELVQFQYHNLVKDPFVNERMQRIDLLFCRNVTIYFDGRVTRRVIENLYNCVAPEGYLFLGHTETLWQVTEKFERVEFPQTFVYKKRLSLAPEGAVRPFMAVPEIKIEDLTRSMAPMPFSGSSQNEHSPRTFESPALIRSASNHSDAPEKNDRLASLSQATLLANDAKYEEAAKILAQVIKADNLNVEAYYLLGVLSYKSGDLREAETQFRKVIYVNPDSILAYFNLGNIYLYQKKFREAAREFRNTILLSEKRPKDEQMKFCEDLTVEFLLRACRNNLQEISKRGERYE
ncbi:MAG: CheR family methyltransferase [Thermodesulfobacteriota bacterium]